MKVAIVTGASSGIGLDAASQLIERGYKVFACARRLDRLTSLQQAGAHPAHLDLTDDDSITALVRKVMETSGRVDLLINNAGYGAYGALEDVSIFDARKQVEVNLFGLARLTQLCIPAMRKQKNGRIINIGSIGGKIHEPMGSWYHATKFALEGMSDCLRMELEPFGIAVILVQPGATHSEWAGIAIQNLKKTSGRGAYSAQAATTEAMLSVANAQHATNAETVAATIVTAATSSSPKTRYVVGKGTSTMLNLRWLLSDRGFDKLMNFFARQMGKRHHQR